MDLEIGIPAWKDMSTALIKARQLRTGGFTGKVHVSVNEHESPSVEMLAKFSSLNVRLTTHVKNIGLYGNFRYLLNESSARHFCWLALDDEPCWNIIEGLRNNSSYDLIY